MKFEKDGVVYEVTDKTHIDCFKAKGWNVVGGQDETKEQETAKNKK